MQQIEMNSISPYTEIRNNKERQNSQVDSTLNIP